MQGDKVFPNSTIWLDNFEAVKVTIVYGPQDDGEVLSIMVVILFS